MDEAIITSIDDLNLSYRRIRDFKEEFLTNFFFNPFVFSIWIKHHLVRKISFGKTDFILRVDLNFQHLYYCSPSESSLQKDFIQLMNHIKDKTITIDIIGNESSVQVVADLFIQNGCFPYTSLVRMSRNQLTDTSDSMIKDASISKASDEDLIRIKYLLYKYFDVYSEQLPHIDELNDWFRKGNILLCKNGKTIQGFLIFDEIGFTSYLRYWFVHPDHREKRIGSKLMKSFFWETQRAKRHLFWVISSNDNAIKRYIHYGFLREDMVDIILTNKKELYGTGSR